MKNIDVVNDYINSKVNLDFINSCINSDIYFGVDASEIEENLYIVRNNASTILNQLFKQNKLVKINSRPVSFFPKDILHKLNLIDNDKECLIYSLDEFKLLLKSSKVKNESINDAFSSLIGAENSLLNQIGQAKAALMYPPKGLHTLILGESGVGKSTFAAAMYEYAKANKGLDEKRFPFVAFNCSDYFNNPQLLLSQLFGHVKGAFTGADTEKAGLVEKANRGILFLDEVHRLPPDGQEMLFFLMDKGQYHKLGESGNTSKSNVMIIAATTEDPNKALLATFLRRIPVVITLPPFREKSIEEKMDVIEALFYNECLNLNKEIRISPEVLRALSLFRFMHGNIGQLKSEIKLLCAKSFLNYLQNNKNISVEFEMLSRDIIDYVFNNKAEKSEKYYLEMFNDYLILSPNSSKHFYPEKANDNIYEKINECLKKLKEMDLSKDEIDLKVRLIIEDHFKDVLKNLNTSNLSKNTLYKIVPKDVVDISIELMNFAERDLNTIFNPKFIFAFAFHINSLIKRISENKTIVNSDLLKIKTQYPKEYNTSKLLVNKISEKFGFLVPEDEKAFLSILLANNKIDADSKPKIGLIVICHGESTASSMADVANKLMNSTDAVAIDMPLDAEIKNIYNKFKSAAVSINKSKGILLAIDMGSLCDFGNNLEKETGIKVRTLSNISTLLLVEALRKTIYTDSDLDTVYNSLSGTSPAPKIYISPKRKAILTFCVTGQGAGMMAKEIISNNLNLNHENQIEIISTNYANIRNNLKELNENYDILACIGSINPEISVPYFPINKIMTANFKKEFSKYLDTKILHSDNHEVIDENDTQSVYEISKEMLEQYLKYINPKIAICNIRKLIDNLKLDDLIMNKDIIIDFIVHMGCMLERCIHGDKVKFDNLENFRLNNLNEFNKIREACKMLEKEYEISINDDEICYIIKVLNKKI